MLHLSTLPIGNRLVFFARILIIWTLLWSVTSPAASLAQESAPSADPDEPVSPSVLFPVLGYTPDTSVMAGATWLRFYQLGHSEEDRPSVFSPALVATAKKQFLVFLGNELYWGGGQSHAKIQPSYMRFPDKFFGVGREALDEDEEDYTPEQFQLELQYDRKVLDALAVGVTYGWRNHRLIKTQVGGLLDSGLYPGTEKTILSAPGLILVFDNRDNTWSTRSGNYDSVRINFYRSGLGSDYHLTETLINLRHYFSLGTSGSLAFQAHLMSHRGDSPFFALPRLGGFDGLRGYLSGRYTDQTRFFVRGEWRSREFWKGLGAAVFAGMGDVAPSVDKLSSSAQLYTFGFGLRYTLNQQEQVKVRVDMGFGNGDQGFYLGLGEAF